MWIIQTLIPRYPFSRLLVTDHTVSWAVPLCAAGIAGCSIVGLLPSGSLFLDFCTWIAVHRGLWQRLLVTS